MATCKNIEAHHHQHGGGGASILVEEKLNAQQPPRPSSTLTTADSTVTLQNDDDASLESIDSDDNGPSDDDDVSNLLVSSIEDIQSYIELLIDVLTSDLHPHFQRVRVQLECSRDRLGHLQCKLIARGASISVDDLRCTVHHLLAFKTGLDRLRSGLRDVGRNCRRDEGSRAASEAQIMSLQQMTFTDSTSSQNTIPFLNQDCCICLQDFQQGETIKRMPCMHTFHAGCLDKWLGIDKTCPICKHQLSKRVLVPDWVKATAFFLLPPILLFVLLRSIQWEFAPSYLWSCSFGWSLVLIKNTVKNIIGSRLWIWRLNHQILELRSPIFEIPKFAE